MALLVLAVGASSILRAPPTYALRPRTVPRMRVSAADEQRMLYSEAALSAFISAEMRHFCESKMAELGHDEKPEDLAQREEQRDQLYGTSGPAAVDLICDTTEHAFKELHKSDASVLSALGSAITYLREYFKTDELAQPLARVGLTDYEAAHHMTDMYMSRRDVGVGFARILQPSGAGNDVTNPNPDPSPNPNPDPNPNASPSQASCTRGARA